MTKTVANFGSINLDHVYRLPHFVQPGETLASLDYSVGLGGKGANQSAALALAGVAVKHIGRVGEGDQWAVARLAQLGVDTEHIHLVDGASGHAIIQIDNHAENAIVLHGGANQGFDLNHLSDALTGCDYLLMQNETNLLPQAIDLARSKGIRMVLNPAPMTDDIEDLPLSALDTLIVNEVESQALTGCDQPQQMCDRFSELLPETRVVITLGAKGVIQLYQGQQITVPANKVDAVDTTAAGDTFVGYFLAGLMQDLTDEQALNLACRAAAITVTRLGAIDAIPTLQEVQSEQ